MTKMAAVRVLNTPGGQLFSRGEIASLESIIKQCVQTKVSWGLIQNDIVFALAFWSMVECGFRLLRREDIEQQEKTQTNLPKDWKHETRQLYQAHFFLPPHSAYPVKLIALPAGEILCINLFVSNLSPKNINLKSLAIYSPGYVPRPEDNPALFSGIADFQVLLKNLIIWPIRCSILTEEGILNGSLCGLSDEMKLKIVRHLSVEEVLMLGQTCHDLNRICNDQGLWKKLYHSSFKNRCKCPETEECTKDADWKEEFRQAYADKVREGSRNGSPSESYYTEPYRPPEGTYGSVNSFEFD